jgi:hypothetical protein
MRLRGSKMARAKKLALSWIMSIRGKTDICFLSSSVRNSLPLDYPYSVTKFNKKLVDAYLGIPYVETKCGYACSDQ